tara:strand:+ start:134 stop:781 length:648 start_codon:yes stop_codon:yes gene_type:complete
MSTEYGRIGTQVENSFRNNNGIYTLKDIYELDAENKWTNFGQLELIQTQTVSSGTTVDFTNFTDDKGNFYDIYFFTWNNLQIETAIDTLRCRVSEDGGSTFVSTSSYDHARVRCQIDGSFSDQNGQNDTYFNRIGQNNVNRAYNGYIYLYNATDSTKFTYITSHHIDASGGLEAFNYYSGVYDVASVVNGFRFLLTGGSATFKSGSLSQYGIRVF